MKPSKASRVEKYLRSGRPITGRIAMTKFGLYRLSECIRRLRRKMPIVTEMVRRGGVEFARYRFVKSGKLT